MQVSLLVLGPVARMRVVVVIVVEVEVEIEVVEVEEEMEMGAERVVRRGAPVPTEALASLVKVEGVVVMVVVVLKVGGGVEEVVVVVLSRPGLLRDVYVGTLRLGMLVVVMLGPATLSSSRTPALRGLKVPHPTLQA